ncbi:MAG: PAS domain S-box protein [Bryobacteraceae bacterium]
MPLEKAILTEQLSVARARIAELESELSRVRTEREIRETSPAQPPSFILESITDAFVAVDREFRYIWVNAEAERLMEKSAAEVLGRSIWDLFPDTVGTTLDQKCHQALADRTPVSFDNYFAPYDRWFFNRAFPTREGGLAIYWREITDQKRAEAELRRQALVLQQVHDSIITTDLEGRVTQWNHGAEKIFGYTQQEIAGQNIALLYFDEDRPDLRSRVFEPLERDGQLDIELRNRRKSGEECFVRLSLSVLRDEAGQPYGMLGVAVDITGQRQAEQALRESEERYRGLAHAIPHIVYITDQHGRTEMVNRHWEEYSGTPADRCFEFNWLAWVHPDDVESLMAQWSECVRTGKHFDAEYRVRNAKGEYRWHLSRAVPVSDGGTSITKWFGTLTDISDRKIAEEALRDSEERFRLASMAVEGIVYDWYPETGVVRRSGSLESIIGMSVGQAESSENWWQDRVHPEDRLNSTLNVVRDLKSDRNSFETEFRVLHADGSWVYACDRGYIIRDEADRLVRVVGSTQNISERRRLERELRENNNRLRFQADILATTDDAVIAIDPHFCVTYCNAGAERLYGVHGPDVIGKPLSAIAQHRWLRPEDEQSAESALRELGHWKGENVHIRNDGTCITVSSTVSVLPEDLGGGMVAVIRDITNHKRAELALTESTVKLRRANEDLLHFAYAASHDLQAPLRSINVLSQLLSRRYDSALDADGRGLLARIIASGSQVVKMLGDLLHLTEVAGNESQLSEVVPLERSLAAALENLSSAVKDTGAVITHDPLPMVNGNPVRLVQLFQNLVGNSLKYRNADRPPEIHISSLRNGGDWIVTVRDNGIGFEPKYAESIFGAFSRLQGGIAGTGIGLAICKRIVERLGGRIWATAEVNSGAVFSFTLPAIGPATALD